MIEVEEVKVKRKKRELTLNLLLRQKEKLRETTQRTNQHIYWSTSSQRKEIRIKDVRNRDQDDDL